MSRQARMNESTSTAKKKERPKQEHEAPIENSQGGSQSDGLKKRQKQSPFRPRTKPKMSERKVRTYRWLSIKYKHSSPVLVQEFSISGPGSPTRFEYQVTGRVSAGTQQMPAQPLWY
ncbi:uncharacterized protein ASPGLDRAFT_44283 [Aspergillus glaucus CBS 516.65]|uniref:Uncharacterized protein n=1 Tax=Aspergillus glaucus CBS 516.65 TaxID=1160497 RepID=A0A1L9VRG7_ASPGL|nr:hypothetical protein ASPGLDRAFT_44283 [Aspergillus glaucus CBS 516.65]OJJ86484.1 hypothetical protein ASPGLDRAFT_44283 [Aspergillus glaucus CBS 516.65]